MNCPGSNVILQQLDLPEGDNDSDFAIEGRNAHEVAAFCLRKGLDAWEVQGTFHPTEGDEFEVTVEMADAVQMYLDEVRRLLAEQPDALHIIEERIAGDFHELFYGTVDDAILGHEWLDITDFKYGVGIAVDAPDNPQLKYYAAGILQKHLGPTKVRLRIVQPRAFHPDGPIRVWETTSAEILAWLDAELKPAMARAEIEHTLVPGDWCRFCPAKLACPLLTSLFGASAQADASVLANFSNSALARNGKLVSAVKHYIKALDEELYRRLNRGEEVSDGTKEGTFGLVAKKANRVISPDGQKLLQLCLDPPAGFDPPFKGEEILTKPELKTPAQIDAIGPRGVAFTAEYAYTPHTGLTVAPSTDRRVPVKVQRAQEKFASFVSNLEKGENPSD